MHAPARFGIPGTITTVQSIYLQNGPLLTCFVHPAAGCSQVVKVWRWKTRQRQTVDLPAYVSEAVGESVREFKRNLLEAGV